MDLFEIYDRANNKWVNYELIAGWNENFKQDKMTDNGKVKCKCDGLEMPNIHSGDWCRLLHLADGETGATYYYQKTGTRHIKGLYVDVLELSNFDATTNTFTISRDMLLNEDIDFAFKVIFGETEYDSGVITINADETSIDVQINASGTYKEGSFDVYMAGDISTFGGTIDLYKGQYNIEEEFLYYVPKNHTQFIVGNVSMVADKINNQIDIQLDLLEPIEIANGIVCETRSFTNQSLKIVQENGTTKYYIHEEKTFLNVLEDLLRTTPLNNDYKKSWLSRIKIANNVHLASKKFNDDTFSEPTLYGILLDKYDNLLGRTPVFYFDINGETDLPYNTERTEYVLDFLRQDGFDKPDLLLSDLKENNTKLISNESWENKADGIVCNFDNLSPDKAVKYVSEYLWAIPEIETNDRNLTTFGQNSQVGIWILKTPHPIKKVNSIKRMRIFFEGPTGNFGDTYNYQRTITDISDKVLEKKQYECSADYDTRNVLWYQEGENIIHLNEYYYNVGKVEGLINVDTGTIYVYQVEYEPLVASRYDTSKDYQTIINQTDGQVSEKRLSTYLEQYLKSLNKADLIIQKSVDNYSEIAELGSRVIDGDKVYLITNVSVVNRNDIYDVIYQLNENHFRKSDNIKSPQEVRKNIAIGYEGLTDRKSCMVIDYYLSTNGAVVQNKEKDWANKNSMYSALLLNDTNVIKPQLAYMTFKSVLKTELPVQSLNILNLLCDGSRSIIDNTICYNLRYANNAEAGKQKVLSKPRGIDVAPQSQLPILYTNPFGEIESFDVKLVEFEVEEINDVSFNGRVIQGNSNYDEIVKGNRYLEKTTNYPLTTGFNLAEQQIAGSVKNIEYNKDMLDIFNFTLGFKINTDKNMILCSKFFDNSCLVGDFVGIKYASIHSNNLQEDDCVFPNLVFVREITSANIINNQIVINWESVNPFTSGKSLVLWDNNQKPILIINDLEKVDAEQYDGTFLKIDC